MGAGSDPGTYEGKGIMSESKAKKDRKLKLMTEEAGLDETAREQAKSISKMYEDRDRKAVGAKQHLVSQLMVTTEKYRTANGIMAALDTVRTVFGSHGDDIYSEIQMAQRIAKGMAVTAEKMAEKAQSLDPDDMDQLCEMFYDKDMTNKKVGPTELAEQLMTLQLCQNVGPNAEDVVEFLRSADEEIEKARENLATFCNENNINFNELCGPHENCPECLCNICTNDCKEGKMIVEGQSARDICNDFIVEGEE